ncbi:hypothetical protein B0J13DRAFT_281001 [Dactylonectria estremocensis]|uniref:SNARE-complex protein Syntaxin-18 N-terminal domain-containing protein n=1 Tax=Dactylonectria estremocensis TaxID=1079267 RepID=A0A9P9F197_9HYPO|nr:hypothetical protein B0J13DRAFT_281001 [Dactylonectria estremocensis]
MDITIGFNDLLRQHQVPTTRKPVTLNVIDGFLKEAHRINSHITTLHRELQDVRQAYLSTAQPRKSHSRSANGQSRVLSDRDREEIDANAKQMIRELNSSIRALDDAEQLRRETESAILRKKYGRGLGALGSWASGGIASSKTEEHAAAEAKGQVIGVHRDGILWFLRHWLELCCRTQQAMMETRLRRVVEKNNSQLATAEAASTGGLLHPPSARRPSHATAGHIPMSDGAQTSNQGFTDDQIQMFEEGNQDMMKFLGSSMEKVSTAEKSLLEIAELQSLLVNNLATQSEHIEQLVTDSVSTAANVGGGNKELKKATERPSTARYTFFAASGLCAFLVIWDLVI